MSPSSLFFYVFGVIFVAELPDKTALAALVMATRSAAFPVFAGTALALSVQSAVAVLAGRLFSLLPPRPVHIVAGVVFIVSAIVMWRKKEEAVDVGEAPPPKQATFWRTAGSAFGVVFIAEWGDLTQIGTAALAARYAAPLIVFTASTLALWGAAAIAVIVGNRAAKFLDPKVTQRVAAVLFGLVGVLLVTNIF